MTIPIAANFFDFELLVHHQQIIVLALSDWYYDRISVRSSLTTEGFVVIY
jgi:hypothetical protein